MENSFASRCTFCRCSVGIGQGVVLRTRGRLSVYCAAHDDGPRHSDAELFARHTWLKGDRADDTRSFEDGSTVKWNNGRWVVSSPAPVAEPQNV